MNPLCISFFETKNSFKKLFISIGIVSWNKWIKIVSKIRKIERSTNKKIALIADLQGVKLRVGKIKEDNQRIKYNQKYIFDNKKKNTFINSIVGDMI